VPRAPLPENLVEFLKQPHAAVIATVRSDGAPYSAATWYDWEGGKVLVNMDFERLRLSHMRRDPRVAITVLDIMDWYRAVTVLGRVVELHDDEGLADIDRLSMRYRGEAYWNRDRKRVTALIEPELWHEHPEGQHLA
jgi:PPOX class probable F420-dependent enzyme